MDFRGHHQVEANRPHRRRPLTKLEPVPRLHHHLASARNRSPRPLSQPRRSSLLLLPSPRRPKPQHSPRNQLQIHPRRPAARMRIPHRQLQPPQPKRPTRPLRLPTQTSLQIRSQVRGTEIPLPITTPPRPRPPRRLINLRRMLRHLSRTLRPDPSTPSRRRRDISTEKAPPRIAIGGFAC